MNTERGLNVILSLDPETYMQLEKLHVGWERLREREREFKTSPMI